MSKEKNVNSENKKSGKKAGHRFVKGRDRHDSFRWGFVEGEDRVDMAADDDLFYREADLEMTEVASADAPNRPKKEEKPDKKTPEKNEAKPSDKKRQPPRSGKKAAKKMVPSYPLLDEDEEDGDLNLPSYGRTPIPTDAELPKATKKAERPAAKPVRETDRKTASPPRPRREPTVAAEPSEGVATPSGRFKKEQMVWDPDKREYVPLEIPKSKEPLRDRKQKTRPDRETAVKPETPAPGKRPSRSEAPPREKRASEKVAAPKPTEKAVAKTVQEPTRKTSTPSNRTKKTVVESPEKRVEDRRGSEKAKSPRSPEKEGRPGRERPSFPQRGDVPPLVESNVPDPADVESDVKGFAELGVSEVMLEALKIVRYLEPTPIQSGVFKQVRAGHDVMGQAQTGTGKTAAFSIPIIEGVEECPPGNDPVALILVPTRELAVQVRDEQARLTYGRDVRVTACYGGKPIAKQISRLKDGVDIIVGTPGRILDLMNRRALSLDALRWVVLDEADRMLDIGFRPDIEKILKRTPRERQTLLFSATLPDPVVRLAEKYMKSPEVLDFSNKGVAVDTIEQYYVTVDPERKFDALVHLLNQEQPNQSIIFTRTKRGADRLARLLSKRFENLAAIHGDLSQGERDRVMGQFRSGKLRYLVATDVVGRGIDVSGISHIINYDVPAFCDDYVHRVGRTGRMGREGVAFTFVTVQEGSELTRIEMRIDKLLKRADLKGFESFAKPVDTSVDSGDDDTPTEAKPVYGKPVRKIRRAL